MLKIAWNAVIYMTWAERNCRIYKQREGTALEAVDRIKEIIRVRLAKLTHIKIDTVNMFLYSSWGLPHFIFD